MDAPWKTEISVWKWTLIAMVVGTALYFWGYQGFVIYPLVAVPLQHWISKKMEKIDARND